MQTTPIVPRSRPLVLIVSALAVLLAPGLAMAQTSPEIRQILDRLSRLEEENRALADEVHQLRQELAAGRGESPATAPSLAEKVAVEESRTEELAQSKVEASQHFRSVSPAWRCSTAS